jgi:hypothetical protein
VVRYKFLSRDEREQRCSAFVTFKVSTRDIISPISSLVDVHKSIACEYAHDAMGTPLSLEVPQTPSVPQQTMMAMPKEKQDDIIAIDHREDVDDDIKAEVLHKEYQDAAAAEDVVQKSPFEELSFFKTISIFRKATFFALLAAFSAAADGYQVSPACHLIAIQAQSNCRELPFIDCNHR